MKILFSFTFIFILIVGGFGQVKPAKKPPLITIDAVTKDGKAVILKSDGTWEYNENVSAAQANGATINIESGLVYRSGEVMPISRTKFYLLSESAGKILNKSELKEMLLVDAAKSSRALVESATNPTAERLLSALTYEILYPTFTAAGLKAIADAKKFETTSDFQGKATFANIPKGTYYLFAVAQTRKGSAIWDLEVVANNSVINLAIDQNNAASVR